MSSFEQAESVAEALHAAALDDAPTAADIEEVREQMTADLDEVVADWNDRPDGWLRVNKARMRTTALCPAQVLGETEPSELSGNLVVGIICDIAAGMVALHQGFAEDGNWFGAIESTLQQERPEVVDYINRLGVDDRSMLLADIDDRCGNLGSLLGDLHAERLTVRERITVPFVDARVLLAAEIDLTVGSGRRLIVEVKSGSFGVSIPDEIRHYALLLALRDGELPRAGCAVALRDGRVTPIPLRMVDLHTAARRVVATAEHLVEIDQRVFSGRAVDTAPGGHCRWCRRVRSCDAVDERVLAELPAVPVFVADGVDGDHEDLHEDGHDDEHDDEGDG